MAEILCPNCNKPNPEALEICQFCGTLLVKFTSTTEPLDPLHPGDIPVRKATSDLERTLPGWLRNIRKGEEPPDPPVKKSASAPAQPIGAAAPPPPPKQEPPRKKEVSPLDFLAGLAQESEDEDEVPDWLSGLKSSLPVAAPPPSAPEPSATDWLADLQPDATPPATEEPEQALDWGFGVTSGSDFKTEEPAPFPADTPDWLAALKAQDQPSKPAAAVEPGDSSFAGDAPASDLPDWLNDLEAEVGGQSVPPAFEAPASTPASAFDFGAPAAESQPLSGETPDWLSDLQGSALAGETFVSEPAPAESQPSDGETPDWLAGLGQESAMMAESVAAEPAPAGSQPSDGETPDWLTGLGQESAMTAETFAAESAPAESQPFGGDLPDWLAGLRDDGATQPPPVNAAAAAPAFFEEPEPVILPPAESLPSAASLPPAEQLPPAEELSSLGGDLPDWLAGLDEKPAVPAEPAPAFEPFTLESEPTLETPAAKDELPIADLKDWLAGLDDESAAPVEPSTKPIPADDLGVSFAPEEPLTGSELPDWLSAAIGETPAPVQPAAQTPPPAESKSAKAFATGSLNEIGLGQDSGIPDWMAGLTSAAATGAAQPEQTPVEPGAETASPFGSLGSLDDLPDWLSGAGAAVEQPPAAEAPLETATEAPALSEPRVERPAAAFESPLLSSAEETGPDAIFSMDVPDWLAGFTPAEAESVPQAEETGAGASLGQAELPSWVQAMRPVETVISSTVGEDDDQNVEKEGPLAGFRSVLPALASVSEIRKPKVYSIKLQVDSTQQAQAALLEQLIASEAASQPVAIPKPVLVIKPLRWIIAAILFLVVLVPAIIGSEAFPLPVIPPAEASAFQQTVAALPEGSAVLVVFDYQPGYAGEMESAAAPVIDHLINKNVRLAFVSSSPSGVLMGERMMAKMHDRHAQYDANVQFVDLGYLPGGAAGIQVFANNPRKALGANVIQAGELTNLWNTQALAGVQALNQFATLIVLTDNPDTGRLWVEQAGTALGSSPMLMVISAQAEPMIRPYYNSGQLRGMVTGLEGGAAYEQMTARPAQARQYWDSYGAGMITTELLVVIGGVWALLTGIRERRETRQEGEE